MTDDKNEFQLLHFQMQSKKLITATVNYDAICVLFEYDEKLKKKNQLSTT